MERFQLFNACRPMELAIEDLPDDAAAIGLTKEALQTVAEKRLRAVRLDTEDRVEAGFAHLYVNVNVTSRGYHLSVEYMKSLTDTFGASGLAVTWESSSSGTHGGNAGFIVSRLSQHLDKFLAAYLGVNEPACGSAPGNASARRSGPSATSGMPRAAAGAPRAGEAREFDGIVFVRVPAGEFRMGSTSTEARDNEQPPIRVLIRRDFWLGKHEVTQGQWQAVMGNNPSHFALCGPDCPVEMVSWNEVQDFISRLNARAGEARYRLPTEAEWEYAARAGTSGDRYGNLDEIAWYASNSGKKTHPVGRKLANSWGLYDMLGNVWEWVEDRYGDYPGAAVMDPRDPGFGKLRVGRGGSWDAITGACRASARGNGLPGARSELVGFRLLRTE